MNINPGEEDSESALRKYVDNVNNHIKRAIGFRLSSDITYLSVESDKDWIRYRAEDLSGNSPYVEWDTDKLLDNGIVMRIDYEKDSRYSSDELADAINCSGAILYNIYNVKYEDKATSKEDSRRLVLSHGHISSFSLIEPKVASVYPMFLDMKILKFCQECDLLSSLWVRNDRRSMHKHDIRMKHRKHIIKHNKKKTRYRGRKFNK